MSLHTKSNEIFRDWEIVIDKKYTGEYENFKHRYPNYCKKTIDFLTTTPNMVIRDRVFPLMGKKYRDAWEYKEELSEGTFRIYYKLIMTEHRVMIYYIGSKPVKSPLPPSDLPSASDNQLSSSQSDQRSPSKKAGNRRR